jgi:hypothetical protein
MQSRASTTTAYQTEADCRKSALKAFKQSSNRQILNCNLEDTMAVRRWIRPSTEDTIPSSRNQWVRPMPILQTWRNHWPSIDWIRPSIDSSDFIFISLFPSIIISNNIKFNPQSLSFIKHSLFFLIPLLQCAFARSLANTWLNNRN